METNNYENQNSEGEQTGFVERVKNIERRAENGVVRRGGRLVPIFMVIFFLLSAFLLVQNMSLQATNNDLATAIAKLKGTDIPSNLSSAEQEQFILSQVSTLLLLPNEKPILSMINNASDLAKQQAFFAGSKNGDILITFPKALKAVIYSPSRRLIINAGPILPTNPPATTTTKTTTNTTKKK